MTFIAKVYTSLQTTRFKYGYVVTEVRAPKVLYHWLKFQSLN